MRSGAEEAISTSARHFCDFRRDAQVTAVHP